MTKSTLPLIEEYLFIEEGKLNLVKRDFADLGLTKLTGVLILRPAEFLGKTAFKKHYPHLRKHLESLDPNKNVANPKK